MHTEINAIAQQYFQKETLDNISRDELEAFISRFPFSGSARYLLAQKVYNDIAVSSNDSDTGNNDTGNNNTGTSSNNTGTSDEIITAGLYFHNPLLLDWLLKQNKPAGPVATPSHPEHTQSHPEPTESHPKHIETDPETEKTHAPRAETNSARGSYLPLAGVAASAAEGGSRSEAERTATPIQDSPIVFQSYHTIDYFASQGIRLSNADLGKDRLGQQLKSFTEWLKSMKKLPKSEVDRPQPADDTTQQQVISNAAHSIEDKEIVTEAMAEVWAKQGNTAKAIAIYDKLSLLDPAKSAYFAAKIDQLK